MGRSSTFVCHTCKEEYYLGYGSYSCWLDYVYSEEEFFKKTEKYNEKLLYDDEDKTYFHAKELPKNKNVLDCLRKHKGHEFIYVNEDWDQKDDPDEQKKLDDLIDTYTYFDLEDNCEDDE